MPSTNNANNTIKPTIIITNPNYHANNNHTKQIQNPNKHNKHHHNTKYNKSNSN